MNKQQQKENLFREQWEQLEKKGGNILLETIDGIRKILFKEGKEYYISTDGKRRQCSRDTARAEVRAMVARMIDEQREKVKETS